MQELVNYKRFGSDVFTDIVFQILKLDKVNELYSNLVGKDKNDFIDKLLEYVEVQYELVHSDLERIPGKGAFIIIANHPYGGLDGLILYKIISSVRPDFKVMANFMLQRIEPIKDCFFPVNPFDTAKSGKSSFKGLRHALDHILDDKPLGIFPAGEVSSYNLAENRIADKQWNQAAMKFIMNCEVPVIPVYFSGHNSVLFQALGQIHPLLRTARLPSELFNKKDKTIHIRIGKPISVKEQGTFSNAKEYGRYLRARTYSLGNSLEVNDFYKKNIKKEQDDIMSGVSLNVLLDEIQNLKATRQLFEMNEYSVFCAPAEEIPNTLHEIGRLREITFREVGEGTNKSIDLDQFDIYYNHLVIWDSKNKKIVGAYRIGKGKEILEQYGMKGFYVRNLFKIDKAMKPIFEQSLELGRSFIVKEYQKKAMPLFLLWKGIFYFLLKNPGYRYLIGPVSISNEFSKFSKSLIVSFIQSKHFNHELSQLVKPRKSFKIPKKHRPELDCLVEENTSDIDRIDSIVHELESDLRIPVLLKKYLSLNAKIIGFNVDPHFNNCLDGLLILDIFDVPQEVVNAYSRELEESNSDLSTINLLRNNK